MTDVTLDHPTPGIRAAGTAQWKAVGLAIRREVLLAAILLGAGKVVQGLIARSAGETLALVYLDEIGVLAGAACFLFPMLVWKGEDSFGSSTLWTLPVGHARHAWLKVAAGWAWAMVLTLGFGALMLLPVLITGGPLGEELTRLVGDPAVPSELTQVEWSTPWWWWLLPFGAGTVTYLLGSTLVLATEHPWRWILGAVFAFWALGFLGDEGEIGWMYDIFGFLVSGIGFARYGLEVVLTSGVESIDLLVTLPSGDEVRAWRELPSLARWAGAVLIWSAAGLMGIFAATWRHRGR
jgi:hypothetical protein